MPISTMQVTNTEKVQPWKAFVKPPVLKPGQFFHDPPETLNIHDPPETLNIHDPPETLNNPIRLLVTCDAKTGLGD